MQKNKFTTYLFYALGEIVLVVIGILIAVSINNWNEDRKQKAMELKLLHEIKLNLTDSKEQIQRLARNQRSGVESFSSILDHLEDQLPYHDSLSLYFVNLSYFYSPQLTNTSYETLKQKGVDIIQNDSLKLSIIKMYEVRFKYISEDMDQTEWVYSQSVLQPFFSANFQIVGFNEGQSPAAIPNNYDALSSDPKFKNILAQLIAIRKVGAINADRIVLEIDLLLADIDKELNVRGFYKTEY